MDAALPFRAMHPQTPAQPRVEVAPVREAVPTVLPQPDQSVAAAAEHAAAGRPRANAELPPEQRLSDEVMRQLEREVEFNEEARELVTRTLNAQTGQVVSQFPAEALLKIRAYVDQTMSEAEPPLIARDA